MRVAITGSSGLIGKALSAHLRTGGHEVIPVVRTAPRDNEIGWNPAANEIDAADLSGVDAVIHLAGAGIGDKRWTDEYKQVLHDSRVGPTRALAAAIAAATNGPQVFLSSSAIGYYGARGDESLDETSSPGSGFLADICVGWEADTAPAVEAGVRTVLMRTGIVLSPDGGALKKQLPLFKFGLGGKMGSGDQWQSWISIDDHVRATEHLLTSAVSGPANLTAPAPVTNAEFTTTLGDVLGRPTFLPVPKFGPKLLLGGELADNLLFSGQKVLPKVLLDDGFEFAHPDLDTALRALLGK